MGDARRGQLLIIVGLIMATLFVGLALVVNSAIYTENVSSRETGSTAEPIAEASLTEARIVRAAEHANWNRDDLDYAIREATIREDLEGWNDHASSEGAKRGAFVEAGYAHSTEGVRVTQYTPGDFMPADEDLDEALVDTTIDPLGLGDRTNWLVAKDVTIRALAFEVERSNLKTVDQSALGDFTDLLNALLTGSDVFWAHFDDGDVEWRVYLVEVDGTGEVAAVVTADDGDETLEGVCTVQGDWATVDFDDRELRGDETADCPALSFHADLGDHDVYWVGADEVYGSYHFIAGTPEAQYRADLEDEYETLLDSLSSLVLSLLGFSEITDDMLFGQNGDPEPFTTSAVYDVTIDFTYDDGEIRYERSVTIT